jgi:LuxR family maltose regulon positive regulatory protein
MRRSEWERAATDLERALKRIADLKRQDYLESLLTFAASARLAIHHQDLATARERLTHAMRLRHLVTWAVPFGAVELRLELAQVCLGLAEPAGARTLLGEIDQIFHYRPDLGMLRSDVEALREQLSSIPMGAPSPSALTAAELRLLPYLQTHLMHKEIAQRLYVSTNTVKTQAGAIYRKLDVSSRAEAVERARQLGLLAG